ncbi:MAG: type VI secretion system contractile sheath small subunit [Deltaproteobacteria bacterium]|jgi:type VI secretion system protein ImpB|nr:type VI secretion system contractile sheath small subunit [Deltaproteobacteria bacterium]
MVKESSIAPKERINVTFKPSTGGALEEIELPLKVMVLGDFLHSHDPRRLIDRKPININKNNFEDVIAKQNLKLIINVPNHLTDDEGANELPIALSFNNLKDFSPEGVARQVPELNKLLELREALVSLKGPLGNLPAFRKAIEETLTDTSQRENLIKELGLNDDDIDND